MPVQPGFHTYTEETASEVKPWSSEGVNVKISKSFAFSRFVDTSFNVPFKHR
jgi:hypothetical protein